MKQANVDRIVHVISVLSKHGLGGILAKYGFAWYLPIFKRKPAELPQDFPQKLRKSMEELGGAYIKLGQLLSLRPDLVPQEYCDEFSKLQDKVPPESINTVISVIEHEFKRPVKDLFSNIDPRPLGSASVAQVHKARLKNGKAVAIKVQRPEIAKTFAADIDIIRYIAQKLQKHLHDEINLALIIDEFERYTKEELNFTVEASHIEDIRNAVSTRTIVVPKVYWMYSTERVLTMDYLDGTKLSDIKKIDRSKTARILIDSFVEQIFEKGTFHADLHPGNVLLLKDGRIGLLDFGIVGHLEGNTRQLGIKLYLAILDRDPELITSILVKYGVPSSKTKIDYFTLAVEDLVNQWWDNNPEKRRVTHLMDNLFVLCSKFKIRLPRDVVLLGKGMTTVESTARQLDPHFNFVAYSEPKIAQLLKQQRSPQKLISHFTQRSRAFAEAISELPTKTVEAIDRLKVTGLSLSLKDEQFRHLGQDLNLSSNRISYSMVSAALILAGALMMQIGPKVGTYSIISVISLSVACIFIFALFLSIVQEAREHNPHS